MNLAKERRTVNLGRLADDAQTGHAHETGSPANFRADLSWKATDAGNVLEAHDRSKGPDGS